MKAVTKTVFKVGDFASWAKSNSLDLRPGFQRRSVWKPGAKSYLIDTLIRGLPIPIVFLRDRLTLNSITATRQVVDGQQRLRTILSYIDPKLVPDYKPDQDAFKISKVHNPDLAGKTFNELPLPVQRGIIDYEIPVHVFSADTEDRDVLQIFARMNATGVKANDQELRNAEYFGAFKTLMYEIAYENLNRWQDWGVFGQGDIARMTEVEEVSDFVVSMHQGVHGKNKKILDDYYFEYDPTYPAGDQVKRRFEQVMNALESSIGDGLTATEFSRKALFNDLFVSTYHLMYGLNSPLKPSKPDKLPKNFATKLVQLSQQLNEKDANDALAKSLRGATADFGSRLTRINYILGAFGYELTAG